LRSSLPYYRPQSRFNSQPLSGGSARAAIDLTIEKFFALDRGQRVMVFALWSRRFGKSSAQRAKKVYPDWRAGRIGMAASTRSHIAELVPGLLPRSAQVEIARALWRKGRSPSSLKRTVVCLDDLKGVATAYQSAAASARGEFARGFPGVESWLTADIAEEISRPELDAEAEAKKQAEEVRSEIEQRLCMAAPRPEATFHLPLADGQTVAVLVPKLSRPAWRVIQPLMRVVTWTLVLGAVTAGFYFWPSNEEPAPAAERPTAAFSSRATSSPTASPTLSLPTPSAVAAPQQSGSSIVGGALGAAGGAAAAAPACFRQGLDTCNCANFPSSGAATAFMQVFDPHDVNGLDADHDGIACESGGGASSSTGGAAGGSGASGIGAICRDGTTSSATGRGACSHHGGVASWIGR